MKPMKNYEQRMRRVLKKFKSMVKKYGSLGTLLCMGTLSLNCGEVPAIPLYGPPPVTDQECYTNEDCVSKYGSNWYCDLNETSPICACAPVMLYGPQMCASDEDCQTQSGANWYCDLTNAYDDGCGGTVNWPDCKQQQSCLPKMLYGPPPCASDEQCQTEYGDNWYCDKSSFDDGCGGTVNWPMCKQK